MIASDTLVFSACSTLAYICQKLLNTFQVHAFNCFSMAVEESLGNGSQAL